MEIRKVSDSFAVSPQIAMGDLAELSERGFSRVISNRPDGEEPGQPTAAEISAAAEAAGLEFRHVPVAGGFGEADVAAMADALEGAAGPVFAFCRTGTRSTLLWSLAQAAQGGDAEEIASAAAGAGYDIAPVRAMVEQLAARSRPSS